MAPREYLRLALVFIPIVLKPRLSLGIPSVTCFQTLLYIQSAVEMVMN